MTQEFQLEKSTWTESDFGKMGWHDCTIHAITFQPKKFELIFDIDYILKWCEPEKENDNFNFYVAPATLKFSNLYNLEIDIESYDVDIEIDDISREIFERPKNINDHDPNQEWLWSISCQQGEISFNSTGFTLFIRQPPIFTKFHTLDLPDRK